MVTARLGPERICRKREIDADYLTVSHDRAEMRRRYGVQQGVKSDERRPIIGRSRPLMRALRAARQCALNNQNLLIRGESGTHPPPRKRIFSWSASTRKMKRRGDNGSSCLTEDQSP